MVNTWSDSGTGTGAIDLFLYTYAFYIYLLIHTFSLLFLQPRLCSCCCCCCWVRTKENRIFIDKFQWVRSSEAKWIKKEQNKTWKDQTKHSSQPLCLCRRHHLWFRCVLLFYSSFSIHTFCYWLWTMARPEQRCYWLVQKYLWYHQQLQWKTWFAIFPCAQSCIQCDITHTERLVNILFYTCNSGRGRGRDRMCLDRLFQKLSKCFAPFL